MVESTRVTESKLNGWVKSHAVLNFPVRHLRLPGYQRSYHIVASCHHSGSLQGGHWLTKMSTKAGWYELDDLKRYNLSTISPGLRDQTAVVLLLVATDKLLLET